MLNVTRVCSYYLFFMLGPSRTCLLASAPCLTQNCLRRGDRDPRRWGKEWKLSYRCTVTIRMILHFVASHIHESLIVVVKVKSSFHEPQLPEERGDLKRIEFEPRSFCLSAQRLAARPNRLTTGIEFEPRSFCISV